MDKIAIIGAGPSGLTAGLELVKRGYNVVIYELSNSIGGISQTIRHNNQRIDIGGHRFFSKDEKILKWWEDILPYQGVQSKDDKILGRNAKVVDGGPDPNKSDEVFLIRHRVSRIYYKGKFFDYPINFSLRTFINMGIWTSFVAGCSYLCSCVHKLPEINLENFYINRFGKKLYSMFFESYTKKVWGRNPSEISADWGSQRVKGVSITVLLKNVFLKTFPNKRKEIETSLIEEFYYPKFGPGQLWETVAKKFIDAGGEILFNKEVIQFEKNDNIITKVICKDGSSYQTNYVFSSMPLRQLVSSLKDVPDTIKDIALNLPYRDFVTVGLLVDKLQLKNMTKIPTLGNIIPDCWIYVQDEKVKLGRIQIFNNWSPYLLEDPEKTVWIGLEFFCQENDEFWNMDEEDTIQFSISELKKISVIDENTKIIDSCRVKIKKAYPAYFDSYSQIDKLIDYLNEFKNLYCIGRNGQHRYNNMDHSMATAFAAIDCMEGRLKKHELWNINTEKDYHEEKNT